jgi:DNA-binding NarL/FixJ family response regulator
MQMSVLVACPGIKFVGSIAEALRRAPGTAVVVFSTSQAEMLERVRRHRPNVLLADECFLGTKSDPVLLEIQQLSPTTRVLVLCDACTDDLVIRVMGEGACGCVVRFCDPDSLDKAVRSVNAGEIWISRSALAHAFKAVLLEPTGIRLEGLPLTSREQEIFQWIRKGLSNKEIGRGLGISDKTVKTHLQHMYRKLNVDGRRMLSLMASTS